MIFLATSLSSHGWPIYEDLRNYFGYVRYNRTRANWPVFEKRLFVWAGAVEKRLPGFAAIEQALLLFMYFADTSNQLFW